MVGDAGQCILHSSISNNAIRVDFSIIENKNRTRKMSRPVLLSIFNLRKKDISTLQDMIISNFPLIQIMLPMQVLQFLPKFLHTKKNPLYIQILYASGICIGNMYTDNSINLKKLSAACGTPRSKISHLLKETFGLSFTQYLSQIRYKEAKRLLTESDVKIKEIAHLTGFGTVEHFTRQFKKNEGISPVEYRKQNK